MIDDICVVDSDLLSYCSCCRASSSVTICSSLQENVSLTKHSLTLEKKKIQPEIIHRKGYVLHAKKLLQNNQMKNVQLSAP